MRAEQSLRGAAAFDAVYRRGRRADGHLLGLRALPNESPVNRYGFSINKRVGGAVVRNRLRRRLRHILRDFGLAHGWDLALTGRPPAALASYEELRREMSALLQRAGVTRVAG
ncbi:MAG: ribonuclease P protein component [Dehalococcoidia bacterium]